MYKLLIVDDDPGVRESIALGLSDSFEVGQSSTGSEALKSLEALRPDVVLLDQNMEGLSGTGVLAGMGAASWRPAVVMFSATMDVGLARRALKLGAQDCLSKPFSLDELKDRLELAAQGGAFQSRPGKPFGARVAELIQEDARRELPPSLQARRSHFAKDLFDEAVQECNGDLDLAAGKLGLKRTELAQAMLSLA